jgi:hypothetical protein
MCALRVRTRARLPHVSAPLPAPPATRYQSSTWYRRGSGLTGPVRARPAGRRGSSGGEGGEKGPGRAGAGRGSGVGGQREGQGLQHWLSRGCDQRTTDPTPTLPVAGGINIGGPACATNNAPRTPRHLDLNSGAFHHCNCSGAADAQPPTHTTTAPTGTACLRWAVIILKVRSFCCSTFHSAGHCSRLGRWCNRSMATSAQGPVGDPDFVTSSLW